jgi:hypothetical protein
MTTPALPDLCWPVDTSCYPNYADLDPTVQARAEALAVTTLRRLSGYRVGGCPVTVRPCRKGCADGCLPYPGWYAWYAWYGASFWPSIDTMGNWINCGCGCGYADCSCDTVIEVELPPPVGRVDEVSLDGVVLDAGSYRVDNGNKLVYLGTGDGWPRCQDMTAAVTEVDTFAVTYLNGYPPDGLAAAAAGTLAAEYAAACVGDTCRLPVGVTALVRQGVSYTIAPGAFPGGVTGIADVDAWIMLWNPNGLKQAPQVWWPGRQLPRVQTL